MIQSPSKTRKMGYRALARELGIAGAVTFLRQIEDGYGNYTEDRQAQLEENTVDVIAQRIRKRKLQQVEQL